MAEKFRIKMPDTYKVGEIIEVRTLAGHVMETGNRKAADGTIVPRNIIHTFVATFEGREVFRGEFGTGVAANPYLAFEMKVQGPGVLTVTWTDDTNTVVAESAIVAPT